MINKYWADRTFDSFITGESNQYACNAAMEVARHLGKYNPLYIYGGQGLGATHLMNAISIEITSNNSDCKPLITSAEAFTNDYIEALQTNRIINFRKRYRSCDALLLDDIQFMEGKPRLQTELFHTIDDLLNNNAQVIVTAGQPPNELCTIESRLNSRLMQGLIVEIKHPELSLRQEFMRRRNTELKYHIDTALLDAVTELISPHFRALEGALIRMGTWKQMTGKEVTNQNISEVLSGYTMTNKNCNEVTASE